MFDQDKKHEITKSFMNTEMVPYDVQSSLSLKEAISLSFDDMMIMGGTIGIVASAFMPFFTENSQTLYKAFTADGNPLTLPYRFKNGSGFVSSYHDASGKIHQTRFQEVTQSSSGISPNTMVAIAAAIVIRGIENKLTAIQETQQEILSFLQDDKRAALKANIDFLTEILENYKFNWENEMYKTNMHIKVLDIRQSAEQNIEFYRRQIMGHLEQKKRIVSDRNTKGKLAKIQSDLSDYRTALNLYGFAYYVEVLLLENYSAEYLENITSKIKNASLQYKELYTECYAKIKNYLQSSVNSMAFKGVAAASKFTGETLAKIPVVSRGQADKKLVEAHSMINKWNEDRPDEILKQLISCKDIFTNLFAENIDLISQTYNHPTEIYFDNKGIYLLPLVS